MLQAGIVQIIQPPKPKIPHAIIKLKKIDSDLFIVILYHFYDNVFVQGVDIVRAKIDARFDKQVTDGRDIHSMLLCQFFDAVVYGFRIPVHTDD